MKILIVDDEKMIRNWLAMLLRQIPDKEIDIACTSNVDDALEYCENHEVHLVITDITMPQRTGLELLEILRETRPNICTAVLSAYDDYQYIRTAMQLGAIDYILKGEMQLSDILSVLQKVEIFSSGAISAATPRGTLSKSNDYNLADFLDDTASLEAFLTGVNPSLSMKTFIVYTFSLDTLHDTYPMQILNICNKTLESENLTGSTFHLKDHFWIIYNPNQSILEHQREIQQRLSLLLERNLRTIVSKTIQDEAALFPADVEALRLALLRRLVWIRCHQYYPAIQSVEEIVSFDRDRLKTIISRLRFLLEIHRYTEAADYLLETLAELHQEHIDPEELKGAVCHCIVIIFLNTTALKGDIVFASHYQNINRRLNLAVTAQQVVDLVEEVCSLYKNELKPSKKKAMNPSLKRVIQYIDQNYMHRLTLGDVAQHVFLNKTYISQMFMKYLNISFVNYLESVRIYKAQELLQNTDMSVTKIAEETGYSSQSYFTKAFKKRVGMSPLKYRAVSLNDMDA